MDIKLEATHLHTLRWAVRPEGRLGTMGWLPGGKLWEVAYVTARTAEEAIRKAEGKVIRGQ